MAEPVTLPLAGVGDDTALVAVDDAGAAGVVQILKFAVSANGSAVLVPADAEGIFVQQIARAESPQHTPLVAAGLAAGGNTDLDADDITTGKTGRLVAVDVGSSVPVRCDIQTVNGPRLTITSVYTNPGQTRMWRPPGPTWHELTGAVGVRFGVSVTNLSPHLAADVRATVYWDEAPL